MARPKITAIYNQVARFNCYKIDLTYKSNYKPSNQNLQDNIEILAKAF